MGSLFAGIWQRASTNRTTAILSVVTLLIILTAVPLTVFLSKQQQTLQQHAAGENPQVSIAPAACMAAPTDTVIIIDKSGSMLGDKMSKAKTAAKNFVDILSQNPKNKVALVTFSTKGTADVPFTSNFSSVKSKIDTIFPTGSTCLECAIKQAKSQIQAQSQDGNKKVVVVLTDGIANAIAQNTQGSLSMVTNIDNETKVLGASDKKIAGVFPTPTPLILVQIYGYVFIDSNGNGVRDSDETTYTGGDMSIKVVSHGLFTKTAKLDKYKTYSIPLVISGKISVTAQNLPSGYRFTTPQTKNIDTDTDAEVDFGIAPLQTPATTSTVTTVQQPTSSPAEGDSSSAFKSNNNINNTAEQKALAAAEDVYNTYKSPFYTIGLGGDVNTDFLKQLASATGGQYNFSPSGNDLTTIYNSISQVIGKGSVTGFAYNDANNNSVFDASEQKLSDAQITLKQGAEGAVQTVAATTTSSTGEFTINNICDGTYTLSATPPLLNSTNQWQQTNPKSPDYYTISVTQGSSSGDKNFGFTQGSSTTPTTVATASPTLAPSPTGTGSANDTKISLTVLLHGIGSAGDNVSSQSSLSNQTPLHPQRNVNVQVYDTSNALVADTVGTINFSSASGAFTGTVDLGSSIQTGSYNVKVKTDQYLASLLPGIQNITTGTTNTMPSITLIAGDTDSDNKLNILDYNTLIGCYSDFAPAASCTDEQKQQADINDDGDVNQFDYNLFLRELVVHYGQ